MCFHVRFIYVLQILNINQVNQVSFLDQGVTLVTSVTILHRPVSVRNESLDEPLDVFTSCDLAVDKVIFNRCICSV